MLSRNYNRKIEIWRKEFTIDQFGGNIETLVLVKSIWAKITTNAGNKFVNFGIQDFKNPVIFSVRSKKNNIVYDEKYFVKYQGRNFFVKGFEDKSLERTELNLLTDGI